MPQFRPGEAPPPRSSHRPGARRILPALVAVSAVLLSVVAAAQIREESGLGSLKRVRPPAPSRIDDYVRDFRILTVLGKALFWDMQVGSDGRTACASCHFNAGEDIRTKNQISPGLLDQDFTLNPLGGNGDTLFGNSTVPFTAHDPNNHLGPIQPPNPGFNVPGLPTFTPNAEVTRDDFPLNGWFNPPQLVPRGPGVTIFQ